MRGRGESPAKRPKGAGNGTDEHEGQAVLTVQTLQMLLAQQSASLLEAQQAGLRTALKELEDRQEVKMDRLDAKLDEASERTTNLETQLKAAVDRIHVLGGEGTPTRGSAWRRPQKAQPGVWWLVRQYQEECDPASIG